MKKVIISLLIIIACLLISTQTTYAKSTTLKTDITDDEFINDFNPKNGVTGAAQEAIATPISNFIITIANVILTIIQVIGGIVTIISVALFGLSSIISTDMPLMEDIFGSKMPGRNSPEYKIVLQGFFRRMIIGAILLLTGSSIVKIVMGLLLDV